MTDFQNKLYRSCNLSICNKNIFILVKRVQTFILK